MVQQAARSKPRYARKRLAPASKLRSSWRAYAVGGVSRATGTLASAPGRTGARDGETGQPGRATYGDHLQRQAGQAGGVWAGDLAGRGRGGIITLYAVLSGNADDAG